MDDNFLFLSKKIGFDISEETTCMKLQSLYLWVGRGGGGGGGGE